VDGDSLQTNLISDVFVFFLLKYYENTAKKVSCFDISFRENRIIGQIS